jgi:molybdopterin converting factor subunit 1
MRVRVLYFAGAAEAAGTREESIVLPPDVTSIGAFVRHVAKLHPDLASRIPALRVARNQVFAMDADPIAEDDELALLPPVAGG